ncbi:hypothetical protein PM729_14570, partial [Enterococcus mundtii]|uniref:hypothetical protein n=1 Tax=Enterococcus mundtii TaxID=53346 RepID=UPI00232F80EE
FILKKYMLLFDLIVFRETLIFQTLKSRRPFDVVSLFLCSGRKIFAMSKSIDKIKETKRLEV